MERHQVWKKNSRTKCELCYTFPGGDGIRKRAVLSIPFASSQFAMQRRETSAWWTFCGSPRRNATPWRSGISVHTFGAAFPVVLCNNVRWLINDRLECNFQWKIVSPQQQTLPAHQIITKMGRVWNSIAQLVVRRLRRQSVVCDEMRLQTQTN